eukprot:PhM_4_TR15855/c0_g1_i1/m.80948
MGQRQAVDVASTITDMLASFAMPEGVRVTTYIDNIRFVGDVKEEVIAAATSFVARARIIGATLNEVGDDVEDVCSVVSDLVVSQGEFLGIDFDYLTKMVRVGSKTLRKLRLLYDVLKTGRFTYQNLIAMFGILFFAMQVTRPAAAKHFYALKEYSRVARLVQRDPALLPTEYKCSASRLAVIVRWVEETLANPWVDVVAQVPAGDSEYLLVTDASAWGWGAIFTLNWTPREEVSPLH